MPERQHPRRFRRRFTPSNHPHDFLKTLKLTTVDDNDISVSNPVHITGPMLRKASSRHSKLPKRRLKSIYKAVLFATLRGPHFNNPRPSKQQRAVDSI